MWNDGTKSMTFRWHIASGMLFVDFSCAVSLCCHQRMVCYLLLTPSRLATRVIDTSPYGDAWYLSNALSPMTWYNEAVRIRQYVMIECPLEERLSWLSAQLDSLAKIFINIFNQIIEIKYHENIISPITSSMISAKAGRASLEADFADEMSERLSYLFSKTICEEKRDRLMP